MNGIIETEYHVEWQMKHEHQFRLGEDGKIIEGEIPSADHFKRIFPREFVLELAIEWANMLAKRYPKCNFRVMKVEASMQIVHNASVKENGSE